MMKRTLALAILVGSSVLVGCSGSDPEPVVGNAPGISDTSKGEESPEVQARTKEKQATQPGSNSQFGRD